MSVSLPHSFSLSHPFTVPSSIHIFDEVIFDERVVWHVADPGTRWAELRRGSWRQRLYDESTGEVTVQVSKPIFLSTWAHPYALPSSDYQLMLQISKDWLTDLL